MNIIRGLVTTIIPVYNRPKMIAEAIESVLNQTYKSFEIVIVDDGSTDGTPEVIDSYKVQYPNNITVIRQVNSGPGVARENGRRLAKGEFIQYLDSDDLLLPNKFESQVTALYDNPVAGIAYGKTHLNRVGDKLKPVALKRTGEKINTLFPSLLLSRWWSTSTPLYRRIVTDQIGPWREFWNEEDWEYEARAGMLGIELTYCDEFVSVTRYHSNQLHHEGTTDPNKLAFRAEAHALIHQHAASYGITPYDAEMKHFSREMFHLARQCGASELVKHAELLLDLSQKSSVPNWKSRLQYTFYKIGVSMIGWKIMGSLSTKLDSIRARK